MKIGLWVREPINLSASVFVAIAVLVGGSSQVGLLGHHYLQTLSLVLIGISIFLPGFRPLTRSQMAWLAIAFAFAVWMVIQMIPLPQGIWQGLGDRDVVLESMNLLGLSSAALPISLSPDATLETLLSLLPPLAVFVFVIRIGWQRAIMRLKWVFPILGSLSVALGVGQLFGGSTSALYLYEVTNNQSPVGFMANINHQATLCLIGLPFIAALAVELKRNFVGTDRDMAQAVLLAVMAMMNIFGVIIAGSMAGLALLAPVLILSSTFILSRRHRSHKRRQVSDRQIAMFGGLAIVALVVIFIGFTPALDELERTSDADAEFSRAGLWDTSSDILGNHYGVGSGLGTFEQVYPLYEDATAVTNKYANHAHNDYLEFALEAGIPGILLLATALAFWVRRALMIWVAESTREIRLQRAASIALMVVILHSLVDYPLRTPAIAVISAACLAIMLTPKKRPFGTRPDPASEAAKSEKRIEL